MVSARPPRSAGLCLVLALALGIAAVLVGVFVGPEESARALTGTTGPVNVTVSPNDGLTDGQVVSIHAATTAGTLAELRAHICDTAKFAANPDQFTFGFGGPACSSVSPGAGDFETAQTLANTTVGDLTFKAGIGTATWIDELQNNSHTLTCDETHSCSLVVQIQSSELPGTFYFQAPLTYGTGGGGTTTTTAVGATTTTAVGATTTTAAAAADTVTPTTVGPGDSFTVVSPGWGPSSTVVATLHSDPLPLGNLTAAADGKVQGSFLLPTAAEVGAHTVTLVGTDAAGTARTATINLTVAAVPNSTSTTSSTAPIVSPVSVSSTGTSSGGLPFTGAYSRNLAAAALLMLGVAFMLLSFRRRRSISL